MKKIWAMMLAILVSLGLIMPASAENVGTPVAKIDETPYNTLKEAIDSVKTGETIVLLQNVDKATGISVGSDKNFTIDFKGHTYTLVGPGAGSSGTETQGFQLLKGSNITFKNGTINVADGANNIRMIIQNYADLTLENMTIKSQSDEVEYALSINNGNVTFKENTTIKANNNMISFDVCKFQDYPKVNVTFAEDYTGTIEGPIVYDSSKSETHKLNIKGNGTFGNISYTEGSEKAVKEGISIHSGTFKTVEALKYLEENAKVTVKLDKDVNESIVIPEKTNVTLDLNGYRITNTDGKHTILNKGNLTIDGEGTVDNTSNGRGALVNDKGAVATIKGGEFTRSKEAGESPTISGNNSWYVISNEAGSKMTIENANVHSKGKFSSLVRNAGSLTIKDGKFENGFIAIKTEENTKLNIEGGTISSPTQAIQSYGDTTITGGKLTGQVTVLKYDDFNSNLNINGGEIEGKVVLWHYFENAIGKSNINIDGAHIKDELVVWDKNRNLIPETDKLNIDVKSGTFDKNVSTYVVNGRGLIKVDGTYYVDEAKVLNEVASKASKSVEILKGIDTISVPAGVEVTNNSGDVVVNGEVLADGQKVTVTNKETVNMTLAAVINGKVIAGEDLVELMKLGGATNITVDDLTEKVEKGYALTKEEVAELEEVMKQFKDEELVFKGFFVDKDGKVKLDESYVFDKDTTVYMIFETKDGDMSVVPTPGDKPTTKPTQKEETVKTDDESNMTLYASFAGLALVGGAIIILNKKREELMK